MEQVAEIDRRSFDDFGFAFETREGQQLTDEFVEPLSLAADPVQRLLRVRAGSLAGQLEGDALASERRAQFVRDVLEQIALGGDERGDSFGHVIEVAGQLAQFVAPRADLGSDVLLQIAARGPADGRAQALDRIADVSRQEEADNAQCDDESGQSQPGAGIVNSTQNPRDLIIYAAAVVAVGDFPPGLDELAAQRPGRLFPPSGNRNARTALP